VVCCRVADYEELPIRLKLQAAVLIAPLTNEQIVAYLAGFGEQLDALRLALIEDAALRELAAAPLMLSIMALAYQGARAGALAAGGSPEELRKLIFERYIDQMFQRRSKQARYMRAQTMRWLVTLASELMRSAQTLFFIEHMQPDWLSPSERKMFTMGEGLAWGLIAGLIVGIANEFMSLLTALLLWSETKQPDVLKWMLIDGPLGAAAGLTTGVLIGMVAGSLPIGGRAIPTATHPRDWLAIRSAARVAIIVGLAVGVARGVTVGLLQGPLGGVQVGFVRGIQWATVWGIVAGLGYWLVANPDTISIVETLRWSWSKAKLELLRLLRYAVTLGFVIGLAVGLINGLSEQNLLLGITDGLDLWLAVAIAAWPTLILIEGLTVGEIEARVAPNQGIRRSASNALKVGIGMWIIGGWMLTIVLWLRWDAFWSLNVGLGGGFVLILIGGLLYGGLACLQHAVLRFILWRNATLPLRLVPFLDYCADRIFLRKVGGGYIFVHRLLMEHFASLDA
jgi:eukaryotic-like serine/threonine-protein kinase